MHVFYRPKCDYPGCGSRWGGPWGNEHDWIYDEYDAAEEIEESDYWICLYDDDDHPRFFCPLHTGMSTVDYFSEDDTSLQPSNAELLDHYYDVLTSQPLPAPECEDTILAVLKGETQ